MRLRWISILAVLFATITSTSATGDTRRLGPADPKTAALASLGRCTTDIQLDCIEAVAVYESADTKRPAEFARESLDIQYTDDLGNLHINGSTFWRTDVAGAPSEFAVQAELQTPAAVLWRDPSGRVQTGGVLHVYVRPTNAAMPRVEVSVRTSWLRPMNVQLVAEDADFVQQEIANGNRWIMRGRATPVSIYTHGYDQPERRNWSAKADVDTWSHRYFIHHAGNSASDSFWPPQCADSGYTVQAFNSEAAGSPFWDASTNSLNFAVPAPHLMASGAPTVGFFKLWTSDAFMDCQWPRNTLATSQHVTVEVVYEDGSPSTALTQVSHGNGRLYVEATNFHYSSPTIKVVGEPATSPSAGPLLDTSVVVSKPKSVASQTLPNRLKRTISCVNVKTKKTTKLNGSRCPAGTKRK